MTVHCPQQHALFKKAKIIDCEWVDRNIIAHISAESIEKDEALRASVEAWARDKAVAGLPTVRQMQGLI